MCGTTTINVAPVREFPYQVALGHHGFGLFYGASIISPLLLLTAAHCVLKEVPSELYAVAGENQQSVREGTEQTLRVHRIIVHPGYNSSRIIDNDIAILVLTRPITFNKDIKAIQIPQQQQILPGEAIVSGWGRGRADYSELDTLGKVRVPIKSLQTCRRELDNTVVDNMVCAGNYRDVCRTGDPGGPLTCEASNGQKYICGILPGGFCPIGDSEEYEESEESEESIELNLDGVYVDVRKYYPWIQRYMTLYAT